MQGRSASKSITNELGMDAAPYPQLPLSRTKPVSERVVTGLVGALDGVCVSATGLAAMFYASLEMEVDWRLSGFIVAVGTILAVNLLHLAGAYKFETLGQLHTTLGQIVVGWLLTIGTLFAGLYVTESSTASTYTWLLLWSGGGLVLLSVIRFGVYYVVAKWKRAGRLCQIIAVVGAGTIGRRLLSHFDTMQDQRVRIIGVFDDRRNRLSGRCMGYPILGTVNDLVACIRQFRIDSVIIALPLSAERHLEEIMKKLSLVPVDVRLCPDHFGFRIGACQVTRAGDLSLLNVLDRPLHDWQWIAKEIEDRVLAAIIFLLIAPLLLVIAILIKLDSPGPVFFKQKRYGFNNQMIEVLKFRTMYHHVEDRNAEQLTCRNDPRVTKVGAYLRRSSLDELPQFINVIRGEMSIVGPRPHALAAKAGGLLYQEAVKYYDSRHRIKPGITGWAQVNGWRGETETVEQIQKRVEYDLYYIEHWSLLLDLKIILRTILGGFTGGYAY